MTRLPFKVNVSIVIKYQDTFLLIKRAEDEEVFPGYWGIPGGTVEPEDQDLEAALARECIEEVGVTAGDFQLISNNIVKKGDKAMLYLVYVGTHQSGDPQALDGTAEVAWKTHDQAAELQLTPFTLDMLALCR